MLADYAVTEYRFLKTTDQYSTKYRWWSRGYEYPWALSRVKRHKEFGRVHNTAWGTDNPRVHDCCHDHVAFRRGLDALCGGAIHSDITESRTLKTEYYDITTERSDLVGRMDIVLNISVIEHLGKDDQEKAFEHLLRQLRPGGILLMTFDYPKVDTGLILKLFGTLPPLVPRNALNGNNARKKNRFYRNLNVLVLEVTRKNEGD